MKRLLSLTLLLASASVMAQETSSKGCRVLIGEDWIPMGATTIGSCLKYAEAAATPGERQFAQFGSTQLSFKDGQAFQSNDSGKTWQPFRSASQGSFGALNTLRAGAEPDQAAATPSVSPAPSPARSTPAPAQTRGVNNAVMPDLDAPVALGDDAPALPAGSSAATVAPPPPVRRYRPSQDSAARPTASPTGPSVGTGAAEIVQSTPRGCQVHLGDKWQVNPVNSIQDCARVLVNLVAKSGAKSGQAYWGGNYLFYSGGKVYHSADGQNWGTLQ